MHKSLFAAGMFVFLSTYCHSTLAGGPLLVTADHVPVRYQYPNIILHTEAGALGSKTNAEANALVTEALSLWNDVGSSTLNLQTDPDALGLDINIDNFETYLPAAGLGGDNDDDGYSPIVYDQNGDIIDAYFGVGASEFVIGIAASTREPGSAFFSEGYAVINGREDVALSDTVIRLLVAHEIGHLAGLDHTQTDINNTETDFGRPLLCSTTSRDNYALMYPFICRSTAALHADDVSAVSALYPADNINQNYGILQGQFLDLEGKPVLGANIWAQRVSTSEVISVVSDFLLEQNGFYRLHLPPGDYTLHANSINTLFTAGSGVGPYSTSSTDISFQDPHPIGIVDYIGTPDSESGTLTVSANQTLTVSFDLNGLLVEAGNSGDAEDEDLADLFGSISILTSLIMAVLLLSLRQGGPGYRQH